MKTILLATGISKFDELLMEYLGKTHPGAFESVGYATDIDSLLDACKQKNPAVLVVKDGLPGKADFLGTMRSIKAAIPDIRIVVLTKGRQAGDPFLTSLIIYNIYDFVAQDKVRPSEIAELVADRPRTFADVEKYAPAITGANEDKFGFATKVLDRSYSDGGRDIDDLNEGEVDPGEKTSDRKEITDAVSSVHADSAEAAELSDITLDEEEETPAISYPSEDDAGIEKVTIAPEGSKLGYRSVFGAFSLHRKSPASSGENPENKALFKKDGLLKEPVTKAEEHGISHEISNDLPEDKEASSLEEEPVNMDPESHRSEFPVEAAPASGTEKKEDPVQNEAPASMNPLKDEANRKAIDKPRPVNEMNKEELEEMARQIEQGPSKTAAVLGNKTEESAAACKNAGIERDEEAANSVKIEEIKVEAPEFAPKTSTFTKDAEEGEKAAPEADSHDELSELYSRKNSLQIQISALMAAVPQDPEKLMATVAAFTAVTSEIARKEKEIEEEKASAEKTAPVQQKAVLGFFRGIPSMNTIALNAAVEIGKLIPVTFIDLHTGRDVYDGFFGEGIPNVTVFQTEDPLRAKEIINQSEGYVIIDSDTSEVFDSVDTWMIMVSQDRFVLESFRDKYAEAISGLKFSYLYPNFIPNAGISEKKIGKLMGVPRRVVTLRDSEGLLGNSYVEKKPFAIDPHNCEAGRSYLEPVMKEAVKLLSPGIAPEVPIKAKEEED